MEARITVVCLIALSLNVNLAYSLDFGENKIFDGPHDKQRFIVDMHHMLKKFDKMGKKLFDDAGGKFVLKSPGYLDYAYLIKDIVQPIGGYLGYVGEEPLTLEELCRQLIGAGTGFAGSVGGASVGSYAGTWIWPGWGTFAGGYLGGDKGYSYGKEFGIKIIGEICPAIFKHS